MTLIFLVIVATAAAAVTYENQYAKLTVTPETAYPTAQGWLQQAELCSKVGSQQSINVAFLFPYRVRHGSVDQLVNNAWVSRTPFLQYARVNPQNFGVDSANRHSYRYEGLTFAPLECKTFRWAYTPTTQYGKWDFVAWQGTTQNPTRQWVLDPYYNATAYRNDFFTVDEINEYSYVNITYGSGNLSLTRRNIETGDLLSNLVHYYSLNETGFSPYYDSGNGPVINMTGTNDVAGIFNQAYLGPTIYSGTGAAQTFGPNMTVRAYVYIPGTEVYRLWAIYRNGNNGIAMHYGDNKFKFFFYEGSGLYDIAETTNTYLDAGWYKIVARVNETTNTIEMYVNGTLDGITGTGSHTEITGIVYARVGGDLGNTGCGTCRIDEIAVWNESLDGSDWETVLNTDFDHSSLGSGSTSASNASYGEAVSSTILNILNFAIANVSYVADLNNHDINVSLSNDAGTSWFPTRCYDSGDALNYYCNGTYFDSSDGQLRVNITLNSLDAGVTTPELFNLTVLLLDAVSGITEELNYSPLVYQRQNEEYTLNLTLPIDVLNVTANFTWNGTAYNLSAFYNDSLTYVFHANLTVPQLTDFLEPYNITGQWDYQVSTSTTNQYGQANFTQEVRLAYDYTFVLRDERDGGLFDLTSTTSTDLEVQCLNGSTVHYSFSDNGNVSSADVGVACDYEQMQVIVVDDTGTYTRTLIPEPLDYLNNITFYLINLDTDTAVERILNLIDLTGDFSEGTVRVRRGVNGTQRDIIEQYFDIGDRVVLYLMTNARYTITVENNEGDSVVVGDLIADVSGEQTIVLPNIQFYPGDSASQFVSWNYNCSLTSGLWRLMYDDEQSSTNYLQWEVYNGTDLSTLLQNFSTTSNSSAWFTYNNVLANASYYGRLVINQSNLPDLVISTSFCGLQEAPISIIGFLGVSKENEVRNYVSLIFLLIWASLFGVRFAQWGMLSTLGWVVVLRLIGWLTINNMWFGVIVALCLVSFVMMAVRR